MCLAIPGKIVEFHELTGYGCRRWISAATRARRAWNTFPDAELGDYVMVHVGFAISKVDEEEAARTYQYLRQMGQLTEVASLDIDRMPEKGDEIP